MILGKLDICVGERVVKLESKAHALLMRVICQHLGGCFIGMMAGKMRITKKQIADALSIDKDDLSLKDMAIALQNIESILDSVAENLDNDFESAALGDASNLVQLIRDEL
jgi:hypothetical protein